MNEVYLNLFLYIHVKDLKDWWWKVWEQFLWGRFAIWKSLGKVRRQMGMERNEEKMITFWDRAAQDMMITFWDKAGPNLIDKAVDKDTDCMKSNWRLNYGTNSQKMEVILKAEEWIWEWSKLKILSMKEWYSCKYKMNIIHANFCFGCFKWECIFICHISNIL